jgi:hypothetical protein
MRQRLSRNMPINLTQTDAIQLAYPDTPDWQQVPEAVLIELIEQYRMEPSCATSAVLQLSLVNLPRAQALAAWLIAESDADQWLKAAAADVLDD